MVAATFYVIAAANGFPFAAEAAMRLA